MPLVSSNLRSVTALQLESSNATGKVMPPRKMALASLLERQVAGQRRRTFFYRLVMIQKMGIAVAHRQVADFVDDQPTLPMKLRLTKSTSWSCCCGDEDNLKFTEQATPA